MKHLIYLIILSCLTSITTSCELETSDSGNLDGNWQLMSIDTILTRGINNVKDNQIFYAIQYHLLNIKVNNRNTESLVTNPFFHFSYEKDSLYLTFVDETKDPTEAHTASIMKQLRTLGINSPNEHFKVESLCSDKMILRTNLLRLHFRKF